LGHAGDAASVVFAELKALRFDLELVNCDLTEVVDRPPPGNESSFLCSNLPQIEDMCAPAP
jgi:hypothetical protein